MNVSCVVKGMVASGHSQQRLTQERGPLPCLAQVFVGDPPRLEPRRNDIDCLSIVLAGMSMSSVFQQRGKKALSFRASEIGLRRPQPEGQKRSPRVDELATLSVLPNLDRDDAQGELGEASEELSRQVCQKNQSSECMP